MEKKKRKETCIEDAILTFQKWQHRKPGKRCMIVMFCEKTEDYKGFAGNGLLTEGYGDQIAELIRKSICMPNKNFRDAMYRIAGEAANEKIACLENILNQQSK